MHWAEILLAAGFAVDSVASVMIFWHLRAAPFTAPAFGSVGSAGGKWSSWTSDLDLLVAIAAKNLAASAGLAALERFRIRTSSGVLRALLPGLALLVGVMGLAVAKFIVRATRPDADLWLWLLPGVQMLFTTVETIIVWRTLSTRSYRYARRAERATAEREAAERACATSTLDLLSVGAELSHSVLRATSGRDDGSRALPGEPGDAKIRADTEEDGEMVRVLHGLRARGRRRRGGQGDRQLGLRRRSKPAGDSSDDDDGGDGSCDDDADSRGGDDGDGNRKDATKPATSRVAASGDGHDDATKEPPGAPAAGESSRVTLWKLLAMTTPDRWHIAGGFSALLIAACANVALPKFLGSVIDNSTMVHDKAEFAWSVLMLVIVAGIAAVFTGTRGLLMSLAIGRFKTRIRDMLFASLMRQDMPFFDVTPTGDITSRLSADTTRMGDQVSLNVNVFLRSLVQSIGVLAFMFWISWKLTLVCFVTLPPVVIVSDIYGKYLSRLARRTQRALTRCNTVAEECMGAMPTVRSFAAEDAEVHRHAHFLEQYYLLQFRQSVVYGGYAAFTTLLPLLVTATLLWVGGELVFEGEMSGGALVSFLLYQLSLDEAFSNMSNVFTGLMTAVGAADKVFRLMHRRPAIDDKGEMVLEVEDEEESSDEARDAAAVPVLPGASGGVAAAVAMRPVVSINASVGPRKSRLASSAPSLADQTEPVRRQWGGSRTQIPGYGGWEADDVMSCSGCCRVCCIPACLRGGRAHAEDASLPATVPLLRAPYGAGGRVSKSARPQLRGELELRDVWFSYPARPDAQVLRGFSLHVRPGEIVALVGTSGGGKSTVMRLLSHMYEPTRGEVLLDGRPLGAYDRRWRHRVIASVGQEPTLSAMTVYENIIYGMEAEEEAGLVGTEEVVAAARLANAHDFITALPDGYDTEVGERGARLSGGQKQRVAIARALIREPVVVLLDEYSAALDAESEHLVQEALDRFMRQRKRTVVVIAHRLSTVRGADRIIVVDEGHAVEEGTHAELLRRDGAYARLVRRQLGEEAPAAAGD